MLYSSIAFGKARVRGWILSISPAVSHFRRAKMRMPAMLAYV